MDLIQQVRLAIYEMIVSDGGVPSVDALAAARGFSTDAVRSAYHALADAHVIVLSPGSLDIWSAPPFSAVPTAYRVRLVARDERNTSPKSWYAPCAWDAFGIPAAIGQDVLIEARCPESGEQLPCTVRARRASGSGVIHLEVPARRFWDDIFYT